MHRYVGSFVSLCVGVTAFAAAAHAEQVKPITTALAIEPSSAIGASKPLTGKLPFPRVRPASAPKPPEQNSPQDVCETLAASAQQHRLPVAFFGNLIFQESGLKPRVVSRAGARGIAQFMPKTARSVGLKDPFNPRQALPASARFLRGLLHRFGNNYGLAAAAYNAGPGRVSRWLKRGGGALPRETRNYVVKITGKPADAWRGERAVGFAHNLTGRIPCSNLKAFADLEYNPAAAFSTRPVRFVLPMPTPNPLRTTHVALAPDLDETPAQLSVNVEMKLPPPTTGDQPGAATQTAPATIVIPMPLPQPAPHRMAEPAAAPAAVAAVSEAPTSRVNSLRLSDVGASVQSPANAKSTERLPLPRAHPLRLARDGANKK
jgi:hypothetical protein